MNPIRSIVVPTDFSEQSQAAVARAVSLALLDGASLHLVHAMRIPLVASPYEISLPATFWEGIDAATKLQLDTARNAIEAKGVRTVTGDISKTDHPVRLIEEAVETHRADLIVMGTHGRSGFKHAYLGSVAERALRTLECPVLVVKESEANASRPITRILVPVDFSAHASHAIDTAAELASRMNAAVDVLHVFDLPHDHTPYGSFFGRDFEKWATAGADKRLEVIRMGFEEYGLDVSTRLERGHASVVITEVAAELGSDLIVMGTRGNTGLAHIFLGSVAERTIRTAPCSVLVVKAD